MVFLRRLFFIQLLFIFLLASNSLQAANKSPLLRRLATIKTELPKFNDTRSATDCRICAFNLAKYLQGAEVRNITQTMQNPQGAIEVLQAFTKGMDTATTLSSIKDLQKHLKQNRNKIAIVTAQTLLGADHVWVAVAWKNKAGKKGVVHLDAQTGTILGKDPKDPFQSEWGTVYSSLHGRTLTIGDAAAEFDPQILKSGEHSYHQYHVFFFPD